MSESKAVERRPIIDQYLDKFEGQIAAALPQSVQFGLQRFKRIIRTEVSKMPKLAECKPASLFGAVIQAAQLGLEPGSALRQCYLVPYGKECQLILGFAGMIALSARSGNVKAITPRAVFKGDKFSYRFGIDEELTHVPADVDRTDADGLTHVYAVVVLADGTKVYDCMTRAEVEAIRKRSPAGKRSDGPWTTDYIPMAMKTVIRRVWKYIPSSAEVQNMIGLDELADAGVPQHLGATLDGDYTVEIEPEAPKATPAEKVTRAQAKRDPPAPSLQETLLGILKAATSNGEISKAMRRVKDLPADEQDVVWAAADDAADRIAQEA